MKSNTNLTVRPCAEQLSAWPKTARHIMANCAIVGGIVILAAGKDSVPEEWLHSREVISV